MSPASQITILLVDNDISALNKHANLLHELSYFNYLQAESGAEALAMYNNFKPDLIIIKQEIPEINGLSLLRLIRRQKESQDVKVVLYSNNATPMFVAQAGRSGVNAILVPPYTDDSFKRKIKNVITPKIDEDILKSQKLYETGLEKMKEGKYQEALESFTTIIDIHENAEVYFNMGYIKSVQGFYEEAIECFQKAISINNTHARAYEQMGLVYEKMGKKENAQKYLEHAGELMLENHKDDEAEKIFNTVLKLRPDTTNVYNSLGIIYRRQGRLEEAFDAYQKAIKVHPQDEHIFFNLGRVCTALKDFPRARRFLSQALKLNPDFKEALELLRATELGLSLK